ncbi:MAG: hypothetical protein LBJ88_04840 [Campylobacteraceae bacterium]|jgi:hypothetical protein|nr:hypothetical protein [Campylobacteraceae bacterium]
MKKLFLLVFSAVLLISADMLDKDFENAKTSQICKKILDTGDFINHIDSFVFYSDDNKTKYFLSANADTLYRDELPIDVNEGEYIEQGLEFEPKEIKMGFGIKEDETHFVTMFLMDNTPYMCYFSDNKRYIFKYDKKTNLFKEACMIKWVGEYEYQ